MSTSPQAREPERPAHDDALAPWAALLRLREPLSWVLLTAPAIWIGLAILQWFDVMDMSAGAPLQIPGLSDFRIRATVVAPYFTSLALLAFPVLAVALVTFVGGVTSRARVVLSAALAVQTVTLVLGACSWWVAIQTPLRDGVWAASDAVDLLLVAVALVVNVVVMRSAPLRSLHPWGANRVEAVIGDDLELSQVPPRLSEADSGRDVIHFGDSERGRHTP